MPTYLYVAQLAEGLTEEDQVRAFPELAFDTIVVEDALPAGRSPRAWQALKRHFKAGDHLALNALVQLPFAPPALNKALFDLLESGVAVHLAVPQLVITPDADDPVSVMIRAYERHRRSQIGQKVSRALKSSVCAGRPSMLNPTQLPEIQGMMRDPALSRDDICHKFGITRSTLYKFLAKHKVSTDPANEIVVSDV